MNSRKAARTIPSTLSRLLKSGAFLKSPPPAFYPLLAHPPPPSLVRSLPSRPASDLPPTTTRPQTPYQLAKAKLDAGVLLAPEDHAALEEPLASRGALTRRRPARRANTRHSKPLPIVFPEDEIRRQFFRDHPFEAYRPVFLAEGDKVQSVRGPSGAAWTDLSQRSIVPTAEDAIAFVQTLHESHNVPLPTAYAHALAQFRTLRAEHETATHAAQAEARAHGAVFFGEIQRGLHVEEQVLDGWANAREIQDQIAAATKGQGGPAAGAIRPGAPSTSEGIWARGEAVVEEDVQGEIEFTGGLNYVERFATRGEAAGEDAVESRN